MDKRRALIPSSIILLFPFLSLVFFAGCTENVPPVIEPTRITLSATPMIGASPTAIMRMLVTPSEEPRMTNVPGSGVTQGAPRVSPYVKVTVTDVEIRYLETNPVQVELVIRGTLPDQCKYSFYSIENRNDQKIKVSLSGIHPADNSCSQTVQNIEYVLPLGQDMPESERGFRSGDYELTVNNYQSSFSIK